MDAILKIENLSKTYKKIRVVDNISFEIKPGEVYGFLGNNGAGKTTTIKMILGLIKPDSGNIKILSKEVLKYNDVLKRVGNIVEFPGFYNNLNAYENLKINAKISGVYKDNAIFEVLDLVGLLEEKRQVKKYSLGMKQRLGIARALLNQPELLILDEPTNGLDPVGIKQIRNLIIKLSKEKQIAVLISSHILNEVEILADRIGIIDNGKLIDEVDINSLKSKEKQYILLKAEPISEAIRVIETKCDIYDYEIISKDLIKIHEKIDEISDINKILVKNDINIFKLDIAYDKLEDYFIKKIGGPLCFA